MAVSVSPSRIRYAAYSKENVLLFSGYDRGSSGSSLERCLYSSLQLTQCLSQGMPTRMRLVMHLARAMRLPSCPVTGVTLTAAAVTHHLGSSVLGVCIGVLSSAYICIWDV